MVNPLSDVDEMIADGRLLDAVDQLQAVAEVANDPTLDRRLVELRHDAVRCLDMSPGRASWPPDYPDPFPGEGGIPEIAGDELSAARIGGGLGHHGCVRVNGLLDADTVDWFRRCIRVAFDERRRLTDGGDPDDATVFSPFEPGKERAGGFGSGAFVRTADVPEAMRRLVEVFEMTGLRRCITEYFAERPVMIANKWVLRLSPSGKAGTDYHQDGAFLGEGIRTIDCWIALSDCGPGTNRPAMDMVPRRFEVLDSDPDAVFDWSLSEGAVRAAMPDAPVVSPTFRAGDAMLFDERLPHRTSVGLDLSERYAIESWFVAPSSYPDRHLPLVL